MSEEAREMTSLPADIDGDLCGKSVAQPGRCIYKKYERQR